MKNQKPILCTEIEKSIYSIRERRVMLDADLARIYGVTVKRLNEQVRRNIERFPSDFMFKLTKEEWESLRSQIATLKKQGRGTHRKYMPFVFSEHGALMLANILQSKTAIQASIHVIRVFIRLRELVHSHKDLVRKINSMEKKYDYQFKAIFDAIRQLMEPSIEKKKKIGFCREK
jgi:hypothetical protein